MGDEIPPWRTPHDTLKKSLKHHSNEHKVYYTSLLLNQQNVQHIVEIHEPRTELRVFEEGGR